MWDKDFAERLAQLRMQKNVSARDMSLSLGQSAGYINNIENGKFLPSMSVFFYICEYLGITPKDFFDTESECPERIALLKRELAGLDADQLGNITAIVKGLKKK